MFVFDFHYAGKTLYAQKKNVADIHNFWGKLHTHKQFGRSSSGHKLAQTSEKFSPSQLQR